MIFGSLTLDSHTVGLNTNGTSLSSYRRWCGSSKARLHRESSKGGGACSPVSSLSGSWMWGAASLPLLMSLG